MLQERSLDAGQIKQERENPIPISRIAVKKEKGETFLCSRSAEGKKDAPFG